MRTSFALVFLILICNTSLTAQKDKIVLVKAGTNVVDYFPLNERYLYKDFIAGQVMFKNGKSNNLKMNYNILFGEIEFIQSSDTLAITKKDDLRFIVAMDTFYYDNGYIEVISGGTLKVGFKQYYKVKDILKKGAYGTTNRGASIDTYNSMWANGNSFDLTPAEDTEFQRMEEYYLTNPAGEFISFKKKNVMQLFPDKPDEIKAYLKANKVDFESRDDLVRFADYLRTL
jgi:hypothetical protein